MIKNYYYYYREKVRGINISLNVVSDSSLKACFTQIVKLHDSILHQKSWMICLQMQTVRELIQQHFQKTFEVLKNSKQQSTTFKMKLKKSI